MIKRNKSRFEIFQWAQLVLTIERSCSPKERFDYQGVYAIGADDKRDLMVIKRASKSKAAQRKGAISAWKVKTGKNLLVFRDENFLRFLFVACR